MSALCNLSQGILEKGEAKGKAKIIFKLYEKGYTIEQIADAAEKSVEEVKTMIVKRSQYWHRYNNLIKLIRKAVNPFKRRVHCFSSRKSESSHAFNIHSDA